MAADGDSLATLRAIDEAFDAKVVHLFDVLFVALSNGDTSGEERFNVGLDLARKTRKIARARFLEER